MTLTSLVYKFSDYCKTHFWQNILVILAEIMAFGFHATHYSYHVDMLVEEYYNGTVLIGAGRFSAPLINYLTNWMQFAPFWHTFLMAVILFVAGLLFALVLKETSDNKLPDTAVFAFWIVFSTFPIIAYQMTFPVLSVVLPYVFVAISVWIISPVINSEKIGIKKTISSVFLLTLSVDMYESHATVYLTIWFALLFIKSLYEDPKLFKLKDIIISSVKSVLILATSIVADWGISKLFCRIFCGTFDFWYAKNITIAWFENTIVNGIKWLFREITAQYVIAGVSNYSVFLFDLAVVVGILISLIISVKKRNAWCVVLYGAAAVSSLSLAIVTGSAPLYRMAQALPVFVALFVMLAVKSLPKHTVIKSVAWGIIAIMVLNQGLFINRYTVLNYERHQYESNVLMNISTDLKQYDIKSKPVFFIVDQNLGTPEFDSTPLDFNNPLSNKYKDLMCTLFNKIIPQTTYRRLDARYGNKAGYELKDAESIAEFFNKDYKISPYVAFSHKTKSPSSELAHFKPEIYRAFDKLGCSLLVPEETMSTDENAYENICKQYETLPAYPQNGYITETDEMIVVKIYQ